MASQDPNRTLVESAIRKEKYKKILDLGTRAADECDSNSVVQNIENLSRMVIESNQLICEGNMSDRIGQTAEVVLDVQVMFSLFLPFILVLMTDSFLLFFFFAEFRWSKWHTI